MFKLRFVFVRAGAGGCEGELGSVCEQPTQLFRFWCLNALKKIECLNWHGLKTCAKNKFL